jgi:DNA-directed RNA polymerase specialized sigma24 family protein
MTPQGWIDRLQISWEELEEIREKYMRERPEALVLLIGSLEWMERERRKAAMYRREFVAVKSLKRAYRDLFLTEIVKVNVAADTLTGKQLNPALINYLEMILAMRILPERQRQCWIMHACEGMSYGQIAVEIDRSEEAVERAISHAGQKLAERIFEPLVIHINIG